MLRSAFERSRRSHKEKRMNADLFGNNLKNNVDRAKKNGPDGYAAKIWLSQVEANPQFFRPLYENLTKATNTDIVYYIYSCLANYYLIPEAEIDEEITKKLFDDLFKQLQQKISKDEDKLAQNMLTNRKKSKDHFSFRKSSYGSKAHVGAFQELLTKAKPDQKQKADPVILLGRMKNLMASMYTRFPEIVYSLIDNKFAENMANQYDSALLMYSAAELINRGLIKEDSSIYNKYSNACLYYIPFFCSVSTRGFEYYDIFVAEYSMTYALAVCVRSIINGEGFVSNPSCIDGYFRPCMKALEHLMNEPLAVFGGLERKKDFIHQVYLVIDNILETRKVQYLQECLPCLSKIFSLPEYALFPYEEWEKAIDMISGFLDDSNFSKKESYTYFVNVYATLSRSSPSDPRVRELIRNELVRKVEYFVTPINNYINETTELVKDLEKNEVYFDDLFYLNQVLNGAIFQSIQAPVFDKFSIESRTYTFRLVFASRLCQNNPNFARDSLLQIDPHICENKETTAFHVGFELRSIEFGVFLESIPLSLLLSKEHYEAFIHITRWIYSLLPKTKDQGSVLLNFSRIFDKFDDSFAQFIIQQEVLRYTFMDVFQVFGNQPNDTLIEYFNSYVRLCLFDEDQKAASEFFGFVFEKATEHPDFMLQLLVKILSADHVFKYRVLSEFMEKFLANIQFMAPSFIDVLTAFVEACSRCHHFVPYSEFSKWLLQSVGYCMHSLFDKVTQETFIPTGLSILRLMITLLEKEIFDFTTPAIAEMLTELAVTTMKAQMLIEVKVGFITPEYAEALFSYVTLLSEKFASSFTFMTREFVFFFLGVLHIVLLLRDNSSLERLSESPMDFLDNRKYLELQGLIDEQKPLCRSILYLFFAYIVEDREVPRQLYLIVHRLMIYNPDLLPEILSVGLDKAELQKAIDAVVTEQNLDQTPLAAWSFMAIGARENQEVIIREANVISEE